MQKMHIAESDKPVRVNRSPRSVVANFAHTARTEIARIIRYFRTVPVQGCRSSILELMVKGNPMRLEQVRQCQPHQRVSQGRGIQYAGIVDYGKLAQCLSVPHSLIL